MVETRSDLPVSAAAILDEIRLLVAVLSTDGLILFANGEVFRRSGETPERLIGTRFTAVRWWNHRPGLAARIQEAILSAASGRTARFEVDAEIQPGTRITVEFEMRPSRDPSGAIVALVAEGRDVTDQRSTERALRETHFRWRTIIDFTVDWEFWLHPGGHFLYSSPASQQLTGYSSEDFMQGRITLTMLAHAEDRKRIRDLMTQAFSGSTGSGQRWQLVRRDGAVRWVSISWRPVVDEGGKFLGVRGSVRDVTEQQHAEEERQRILQAYRTLARHFPKGIVALLDRNLRFLVCDGPACSALPFEVDYLIGRTLHDVFGRDDLPVVDGLVQGAIAGNEVADIVRLGSSAWLVHLTPIQNSQGEVMQIIASAVQSQDPWAESTEQPTSPG